MEIVKGLALLVKGLALLVIGFMLLVKGADVFVDGASGLAKLLGVPPLVVGLTVVAMGTSAPEAAVSISSGLKDVTGIAVGNVLGSNLMNVLVILGLTAVIVEIPIQASTFRIEIPFTIGITVLLLILGIPDGLISRFDAAILLIFFIAYLAYTVVLGLREGGEAYAQVGTERSKGTKVFAMVGKVKHTGLVEVPMGTTLRTLIYDIGGGIIDDRPFKAIQTGGPSGGCIPEELLDLPVDFDTLVEYGAMMGSGGMIVMDDRSCMVEVARYYVDFLCEESCGKCTPCREGLRQMRAILTDICEGRGKPGDIELLERIGRTMQDASLCALGRTAPNPVMTTIKFFRDEYEAHIDRKECPAGVCAELTQFAIKPDACTGCGLCSRACPAGAISGDRKEVHVIDPAKCIACGSCREACRFDAVLTERRPA